MAKQGVCLINEKLNLCMLCDIVEVTLPCEGGGSLVAYVPTTLIQTFFRSTVPLKVQ